LHSVIPRKNVTYWAAKIARNKERDREHEIRLSEAGWDVIRVWEHDDPAEAADRLEARLNPV
jgi:DNA mismatch endonuclease (patch repair protein)